MTYLRTREDRIHTGHSLLDARDRFVAKGTLASEWKPYLRDRRISVSVAERCMKLVERIVFPETSDAIAGVYFIQGIDGGPIKIGESGDVMARLRDLQACSPVVLHAIGVIDIAARYVESRRKTEQAWHSAFSRSRLHGEWFRPTPSLLDQIQKLARSIGGAR